MMESAVSGPEKGRQKKSGQQVGRENVERLRNYLSRLRTQGRHLPARDANPNYSAIALACGFNRQTFYNNSEAQTLLNRAVKEMGLESQRPEGNRRVAHAQKQLDARDRRIQDLEEKLTTRTAEVETLRRKVKELEERLCQCSMFEEVMATNGRRYIP